MGLNVTVKDEREDVRTFPFSMVLTGDIFEYDGDFWMKLTPLAKRENLGSVNAWNLRLNAPIYIGKDTLVQPVNAIVTIASNQ